VAHQQAYCLDCIRTHRETHQPVSRQTTFYQTYGYLKDGMWNIPLQAWVSEPPDRLRQLIARGAMHAIREMAELEDLTDLQQRLYRERTSDFVADSKSRTRISIQFDQDPENEHFRLIGTDKARKTDFNGRLDGVLHIPETRIAEIVEAQGSNNGWLAFHSTTETAPGKGRVQLVPPGGTSVISDIDDTIKVTNIPNGRAEVLNNTFFKEFEAVPCMASMYQGFDSNTVFHYVSGAPWQLYRPLSDFLFSQSAGFPPGSVHMKNARTNPFESETYRDMWQLLGIGGSATVEQKTTQITELLRHFPERQFILIGDSGEHDPEIFKSVKSNHPQQVKKMFIRDITNAKNSQPSRLQGMTILNPKRTL